MIGFGKSIMRMNPVSLLHKKIQQLHKDLRFSVDENRTAKMRAHLHPNDAQNGNKVSRI
jgi:hypothetical protein